ELLRKDLDLGLALGREWDVPMPVTAATREVLQTHFGAATLKSDPEEYLQKDFAALMETMALAAGMKLESENKNVPTGLEHLRAGDRWQQRYVLWFCAYPCRKTGSHPLVKPEGRPFPGYALLRSASGLGRKGVCANVPACAGGLRISVAPGQSEVLERVVIQAEQHAPL